MLPITYLSNDPNHASDAEAIALWDRSPGQAFQTLRCSIIDVMSSATEIHQATEGAPGRSMIEIQPDQHWPLHDAISQAHSLWNLTPIHRYIDRPEPVHLDTLARSHPGRWSATSYHQLCLMVGMTLWNAICEQWTAREWREVIIFASVAGDHLTTRFSSMIAYVDCESTTAIQRFHAEGVTRQPPVTDEDRSQRKVTAKPKRRGRSRLENAKTPEERAKFQAYVMIQDYRTSHPKSGPQRLREHFAKEPMFQNLLRSAKKKLTTRFFHNALKWINDNKSASQN